jgi:SAM-dependent MidA family methyltransferase
LARTLHRGGPDCLGVLVHVLVERSPAQRALHHEHLAAHAGEPDLHELAQLCHAPRRGRGPVVVSAADLPPGPVVGVVFANELLDNLPFALLERTADGWDEIRVGRDGDRLVEAPVEASARLRDEAAALAPAAMPGARIPLQHAARAWLVQALGLLVAGRVVVIDYADETPSLAARPWTEWLRTYRGHERAGHPLDAPGTADITCDVAVDQLASLHPPTADRVQAAWLRAHGIDELVEEARVAWRTGAAVGDLAALRARSRVGEGAALLDPAGLGAFRVLEWEVG